MKIVLSFLDRTEEKQDVLPEGWYLGQKVRKRIFAQLSWAICLIFPVLKASNFKAENYTLNNVLTINMFMSVRFLQFYLI